MKRKRQKLGNIERTQTDLTLKQYHITAKNDEQKSYMKKIKEHNMVFCYGRAGTGKTCVAVSIGILELCRGKFDKLVICRPMVDAGEDMGALPGDVSAKLYEYLVPIYDELQYFVSWSDIVRMINSKKIQIVPFGMMRGRTIKDAFIVADECQNCTEQQLKMLCTRVGENSKLILTGDIVQSDLPEKLQGGYKRHIERFDDWEGSITTAKLHEMVRSEIVSEYLDAWGDDDEEESSKDTKSERRLHASEHN